MMLLLSGEGPSDLGAQVGEHVQPGPLAVLVDQLIEAQIDFSPLGCGCARAVGRPALAQSAKRNGGRLFRLPGRKLQPGYLAHSLHAGELARIAKELSVECGDSVLAIYFRDADGTHSSPRRHWEYIVQAVEHGYAAADFTAGVVMIPKPKQEAWFLCALKENPYVGCEGLEDEPGNDGSPRALKRQLREVHGGEVTTEVMIDWVDSGAVDFARIDMPSLNYFRDSLAKALVDCLGKRQRTE